MSVEHDSVSQGLPAHHSYRLQRIKKIKLNQAACCDASEAAHAFPPESYPAAAHSEMSNANKDE